MTKVFNGGEWTEGRFNGFIKNILRNGSNKWPPKWSVKKKARLGRNRYECSGYEKEPHECTNSEAVVDHIDPVVPVDDPNTSWDTIIKRLYVEEDKLQVLCTSCHKEKTKEENRIRRKNAKRESG
jgi:5-methylcytosine-specific restriction endonuclease McrA